MLGFTNSILEGKENKMSYVSWETGCLEGARVSCQRHEDGKGKKECRVVSGRVSRPIQTHACVKPFLQHPALNPHLVHCWSVKL